MRDFLNARIISQAGNSEGGVGWGLAGVGIGGSGGSTSPGPLKNRPEPQVLEIRKTSLQHGDESRDTGVAE